MKKVVLTFIIIGLFCVGIIGIFNIPKDKKVIEYSETLIECTVKDRQYKERTFRDGEHYFTIVEYNGFIDKIDDKSTYENSKYSNKTYLKLVILKYDDGEIKTFIAPLHKEVII